MPWVLPTSTSPEHLCNFPQDVCLQSTVHCICHCASIQITAKIPLLGVMCIVVTLLERSLPLSSSMCHLVTNIRVPRDFRRTWFNELRSLTQYSTSDSSRASIDIDVPYAFRSGLSTTFSQYRKGSAPDQE